MKKWHWIFVVLVAIILVVAAELAQKDVNLRADCDSGPKDKVDRIPFVVGEDRSPLRLNWWETFTPTKIQSFWIWFNVPVSSTPILQVEAGRKVLFSYPVENLTPHRDQGNYPSREFGAGQHAYIDIALLKPGTMRSSDSDLVLSVLSEGTSARFLCSDSHLQLTGVRTSLIAYWIKNFIYALKPAV